MILNYFQECSLFFICIMGNELNFEMLRRINVGKSILFIGIIGIVITFFHLFVHPYVINFSVLSHSNVGLASPSTGGRDFLINPKWINFCCFHGQGSGSNIVLFDETRSKDAKPAMKDENLYGGSIFERVIDAKSDKNARVDRFYFNSTHNASSGGQSVKLKFDLTEQKGRLNVNVDIDSDTIESGCPSYERVGKEIDCNHLDKNLRSTSSSSFVDNSSLPQGNKIDMDIEPKFDYSNSSHYGSLFSSNHSIIDSTPTLRKKGGKILSITQMNSFLLDNTFEVKSNRQWRSSARDKELQDAKLQIENAPMYMNVSEIYASMFRNYPMFRRSYELMERTLKVYVYSEGNKPYFHLPYLRGIYASEGWFMKLIERNKQFVVKDPKKAHLFYLAFSTLKLRTALGGQKDIQNHLKNYVDLISTKYRFWNKSSGADHFFVACHDWAPRATRNVFGTSIRALCNSNVANGFRIGKDVSLPVTYIRSSENPLVDVGGNSPSSRTILAFFAGAMHGNVRPILLQHWFNKEPDMKIFGPLPRDDKGKTRYREFMNASKYCLSVKGYEVHTPRVVEAIYHECIPVIISDNYVPPFFEIFSWEAFAIFIPEKDIPNLRNILLSIPHDRYLAMQRSLKIVQRHFLWHKIPERYDLFHMILHSVWHNRVIQFPG